MGEWYFPETFNPADMHSNDFVDSKFGVDKWSSFTREIIQNSLDAKDTTLPESTPVRVKFELNKKLGIKDVPGGDSIRSTLENCVKSTSQDRIKTKYTNGLKLLDKDNIFCIKISDYNTIGVKSGRDEAWGALIFDTGKSVKNRADSAGSHGVGKKVPFMISSISTVFYATKTDEDCLVQGKSILIDFRDDQDIRHSNVGWYGVRNIDDKDGRNSINPIDAKNQDNEINDFFLRTDEKGTDVIIVGLDVCGKESEAQDTIVRAVLENFFVAIIEHKLVVEIVGFSDDNLIIDAENFDAILNSAFLDSKFSRESDTLITGNLMDYYDAYVSGQTEEIPFDDLGKIVLYYNLRNRKNKKYYSLVRSHGMKIRDYKINAQQPFSAIALVCGKDLNEILGRLENAAHDDFSKDEEYVSKEDVEIYKKIETAIRERLIQLTEIEAEEEMSIDGLSDLLSLSGEFASLSKKNSVPRIKTKNKIKRKSKTKTKRKPKDVTPEDSGDHKPKKSTGKNHREEVENFAVEPFLVYENGWYVFKFQPEKEVQKPNLYITAIGADYASDETIGKMFEKVVLNDNEVNAMDGFITNCNVLCDSLNELKIKIDSKNIYKLDMVLYDNKKIEEEETSE